MKCGAAGTPCVLAFTSDWIKGLESVYNARNTINIAAANLSLAGNLYSANCDNVFTAAKISIDNLRAAGIATAVASGNNGATNEISFPACISTSISVGATTKSDAVATNYSNSATILNLLAPGSLISSSIPGNTYASQSGTSMAAPHVAGAWAVIKSSKPTATVNEVLNSLVATGKLINDTRNGISKPRINVNSVLNQINGTFKKLVPVLNYLHLD